MSLLWEKSTSWRWLVRRTRESKPFFIAFATICGVVPGVIGYGVMQFTNKQNPELEARLRQTARPDSLVRTLSLLFESFQFIVLLVGLLCFFIIWYGKFLDFYVFVGLWHWFLMGLDWAGFSDFVWRLRFNVNFISCQTYPKCELYFLQNRTCFKF